MKRNYCKYDSAMNSNSMYFIVKLIYCIGLMLTLQYASHWKWAEYLQIRKRQRENYFEIHIPTCPPLKCNVNSAKHSVWRIFHRLDGPFSHSLSSVRVCRLRWASINMEISLMEKCTGESHARKRPAIKIVLRETIVAAENDSLD